MAPRPTPHRTHDEHWSNALCIAIARQVHSTWLSARDEIGDSDLDNEQPVSVTVRLDLGTLRKLDRAIRNGALS